MTPSPVRAKHRQALYRYEAALHAAAAAWTRIEANPRDRAAWSAWDDAKRRLTQARRSCDRTCQDDTITYSSRDDIQRRRDHRNL